MKKILFVIAIFISVTSFSQSKAENKVAGVVQALKKAMVDADSVTLMKILSPRLSYGHSNGVVDTKASFIRGLVSGKSDFASIDLSEQTIDVNGKTAIVRHVFNGATLDGGKPGTLKIHVLTVWEKKGGRWKLLARQAIKLA